MYVWSGCRARERKKEGDCAQFHWKRLVSRDGGSKICTATTTGQGKRRSSWVRTRQLDSSVEGGDQNSKASNYCWCHCVPFLLLSRHRISLAFTRSRDNVCVLAVSYPRAFVACSGCLCVCVRVCVCARCWKRGSFCWYPGYKSRNLCNRHAE